MFEIPILGQLVNLASSVLSLASRIWRWSANRQKYVPLYQAMQEVYAARRHYRDAEIAESVAENELEKICCIIAMLSTVKLQCMVWRCRLIECNQSRTLTFLRLKCVALRLYLKSIMAADDGKVFQLREATCVEQLVS
jgi:hypothetical protein